MAIQDQSIRRFRNRLLAATLAFAGVAAPASVAATSNAPHASVTVAQPAAPEIDPEMLREWKRLIYALQRRDYDRSVNAAEAFLDTGVSSRDMLALVEAAGRPGRINEIFNRRPFSAQDDTLDRRIREIEELYAEARDPFISDARALLESLRAGNFDDAAGPAFILADAVRSGAISQLQFAQIGEEVQGFGVFREALDQAAADAAGSDAAEDIEFLATSYELGSSTDAELLSSYLFYVNTDQDDLADAQARVLLARGIDAEDFVDIVRESGRENVFPEAIARSRRSAIPSLREAAVALDFLRETGFRVRARRPDEIDRNILLLAGNGRQRIVATERLLTASGYALPQLLDTYTRNADPLMRIQARRVLAQMPRQVSLPIGLWLDTLPPDQQVLMVGLLREYDTNIWVPFVQELREETQEPTVREACERALRDRFAGQVPDADVSQSYFALARDFYSENLDFTTYRGEDIQLFWITDQSGNLFRRALRTEVYHEAVTMMLSERSLRLRASSNPALSLWLAANYSREIDSPVDYSNPVYPPTRPTAGYFAQAFGSDHAQWVLALALDTRDTPLALRAIEAIRATSGSVSMRTPISYRTPRAATERRPLIDALTYSNRRVQYEAAIAIAASQPDTAFDGANRVVPLLASAVRDSGKKIVAVITPDAERQGSLRDFLSSEGWEVLAAPSLADLNPAIESSPGVDLVIVETPAENVRDVVRAVRDSNRLGATPVLAMGEGVSFDRLVRPLDRDPTISVRRNDINETRLVAAIDDLLETASGGLIEAQDAGMLADAALERLRDIAVSGSNTILDASDASSAMIAALSELEDSGADAIARREVVAEILSRIDDPSAQRSLVDAALRAAAGSGISSDANADRWSADVRHAVALINAASDSAKRFGGMLRTAEIEAVTDLVVSRRDDPAVGDNAASLMGSLGLPNEVVLRLIVESDESRVTSNGR